MTERTFKVGDVISLCNVNKLTNEYNTVAIDKMGFTKEYALLVEKFSKQIKLKIVELPEVK